MSSRLFSFFFLVLHCTVYIVYQPLSGLVVKLLSKWKSVRCQKYPENTKVVSKKDGIFIGMYVRYKH